MRLIFEHPLPVSLAIAAIGIVCLWRGLREGLFRSVIIGSFFILVAIIAYILGVLTVTPTEHAKTVIYGFIDAVVQGDITSSMSFLADDVILVDTWNGKLSSGSVAVGENILELHRRHTLRFNTVLRFVPIERDYDVLVELSLITRISGIGTVPSRWRLVVSPSTENEWSIQSIDAIEIAGRSLR